MHGLPNEGVRLRKPVGGSKTPTLSGKPGRQSSLTLTSRFNSPDLAGEDDMPKTRAGAASEMAKPEEAALRGGGPASAGGFSKGSLVATALVAVTAASFYQVKYMSAPGGSKGMERDGNYLKGLAVACLALVGNAMVGAFRKILSQHNIGSAQQVGLAALIQGVCAILHCFHSGDLKLGSGKEMFDALPSASFWYAAVAASVLNSVVKTLETKAFAESDISLCAPFLAFDPVMQFVVGVVVMPVACSLASVGCDEAKSSYPPYHVLSVMCIAYGAFLLGQGTGTPKKVTGKESNYKLYFGLPRGSWYILLNCVIYGFTSRLDKVAITSAGKTLYYAYGRLLMAATTLGGSLASGGMTTRYNQCSTKPPLNPK